MRLWRFGATLLLLALAARPCVVSPVRKLWSKKPGSESRLFAFERNGRVGFIDPKGKVVVQPAIEAPLEDVGDFSNGRARVDSQGYIDETGRFAIAQKFLWEYDFSDGLAQVLVDDPARKYEKISLILDAAGKTVARIPTQRSLVFSEGLAVYEAEGKPGVRKFEAGSLFYRDYPGLKGFVDRTGHIVIQPKFAELGPFVDGLARAVEDGYCHIATPDGGRDGSPTTGYPSDCGGAPADVVSPCRVGFIKPDGSFAVQPRFNAALDFQEGLAAVRVGGAWGFIDRNGNQVIPPRFEQVRSFQEGLAPVMIQGKWGFIDRKGISIIPSRFEEVEAFSDSLAIAYRRGRPFYIDRGGRTRIGGPFLEATPFVHGLAAVLLSDKQVSYIDPSGKSVFQYSRR